MAAVMGLPAGLTERWGDRNGEGGKQEQDQGISIK